MLLKKLLSRPLPFILCCFSGQLVKAQPPASVRYRDMVFTDVIIHQDILYQPALQPGIPEKQQNLDLYEPAVDTASARPLILFLHGGGFKFGSNQRAGTPLWSHEFSQRFRIDTRHVFLAGNSAGGRVVLQAAYGSDYDMLRLAGREDSTAASHQHFPISSQRLISGVRCSVRRGCDEAGYRSSASMAPGTGSFHIDKEGIFCLAAC